MKPITAYFINIFRGQYFPNNLSKWSFQELLEKETHTHPALSMDPVSLLMNLPCCHSFFPFGCPLTFDEIFLPVKSTLSPFLVTASYPNLYFSRYWEFRVSCVTGYFLEGLGLQVFLEGRWVWGASPLTQPLPHWRLRAMLMLRPMANAAITWGTHNQNTRAWSYAQRPWMHWLRTQPRHQEFLQVLHFSLRHAVENWSHQVLLGNWMSAIDT